MSNLNPVQEIILEKIEKCIQSWHESSNLDSGGEYVAIDYIVDEINLGCRENRISEMEIQVLGNCLYDILNILKTPRR